MIKRILAVAGLILGLPLAAMASTLTTATATSTAATVLSAVPSPVGYVQVCNTGPVQPVYCSFETSDVVTTTNAQFVLMPTGSSSCQAFPSMVYGSGNGGQAPQGNITVTGELDCVTASGTAAVSVITW